MSFEQMMRDIVVLVDSNGNESEPINCAFSANKVRIFSDSLDVEEGYKALRVLPNGKRETYTVLEVIFTADFHSIPASYGLIVRKDASLVPSHTERATNISINHSQGFQIGDHNVQNIVASFSQLIHQIESSSAPATEKKDAKNKFLQFITNPLVTSILGGASGPLVEMLSK